MGLALAGKRIFIVEDDPYNIGIISMLLEHHGATVKIDGWGVRTQKAIMEFAPVDLVLLDLMIGDSVSGYDIFEEIREMPQLKDKPIAIVSASDPDVEMNKARKMGLDGFICKPVEFLTFPKKVATLLKGKQVWGDL